MEGEVEGLSANQLYYAIKSAQWVTSVKFRPFFMHGKHGKEALCILSAAEKQTNKTFSPNPNQTTQPKKLRNAGESFEETFSACKGVWPCFWGRRGAGPSGVRSAFCREKIQGSNKLTGCRFAAITWSLCIARASFLCQPEPQIAVV